MGFQDAIRLGVSYAGHGISSLDFFGAQKLLLYLIDPTLDEFGQTGGAISLETARGQLDAGLLSDIEDIFVFWDGDSAIESDRRIYQPHLINCHFPFGRGCRYLS